MKNPKSEIRNPKLPRFGFTLMELLIVMLIITILVAISMLALAGTAEQAREARTKAIVTKIDQLIMERWNGYETRTLPLKLPAGMRAMPEVFSDANGDGFWNPGESYTDSPPFNGTYDTGTAAVRLLAIRDLQRMEMPDRKSDVTDPPADLNQLAGQQFRLAIPSLQRSYQRKAALVAGPTLAGWTESSQGAECLYLIVSTMKDGDKNALDFFSPREIGDYDGDGMKEILDGWGRPIEFLRWAPGYRTNPGLDGAWGIAGADDDGDGTTDNASEAGLGDDRVPQTLQKLAIRDPFDPFGLDATSFALHPLIFSSGRDEEFDIFTDNNPPNTFHYSPPATPDNNFPRPYAVFLPDAILAGTVYDRDANGYETWQDNITNHFQSPE